MNVGEHVAAATADYDLDHPQAKAAVQNQTPQTRARLIDGAASAEDWKALAQTHELRAEELSRRQRADVVAEARLANAAWSRWEAAVAETGRVADVTGETVAPDIDRILREVHTKRETDPIQAAGPPLEYRYEDFRRDLHAGVTAPDRIREIAEALHDAGYAHVRIPVTTLCLSAVYTRETSPAPEEVAEASGAAGTADAKLRAAVYDDMDDAALRRAWLDAGREIRRAGRDLKDMPPGHPGRAAPGERLREARETRGEIEAAAGRRRIELQPRRAAAASRGKDEGR